MKILRAIYRFFFPIDENVIIEPERKKPYKYVSFRKQQLIGTLCLSDYRKSLRYFRVVKKVEGKKSLTYKLEMA